MPLSIIIVNYHAERLILEAIRSIPQNSSANSFEIIVVSNGSNEVEKEKIIDAFPSVQWIEMYHNSGFARANNTGMKAAKGDTFLLLNPDTLCADNSIQCCYEQLTANNFVAAGVQLFDTSGVPQISGSYFVKGGLNHLLPIPYWGWLIRWLAYRLNRSAPGVANAAAMQEVDWISGAFLMVKRSAVEQVGMMDEDFFLYGEEVEWCSRLKKAGKLVLFGDLKIVHLEGATINESQNLQERGYYNLYDRKGLQLMVSNHLRVRKQYGAEWFLFLLANYTWGAAFFAICGTLHRLITLRSPLPLLRKAGLFAANVARLWRLAPAIIRNRPHFYKMF